MRCVWWVWARFGVAGVCGERACCRVQVQHCVACGLHLDDCCCGGCLGVWWVVGDLYSGCEHLYFLCFVFVFSFVGHSVDALASRADEGRCGLRYASGSWRASLDPRVSEWGNLALVVWGYCHLNVYRVMGGTRGSETS